MMNCSMFSYLCIAVVATMSCRAELGWTRIGGGRWNDFAGWDAKQVPSAVDSVFHTRCGGELVVDAPASMHDLSISHNDTAVLRVVEGGHLSAAGTVEVGNAGVNGVGRLQVDGGDLRISGDLEVAKFGNARQGFGVLNSGRVTVAGKTYLGSCNRAPGTVSINGGTWVQEGGTFNVARVGDGTLNMNGGTLHISSPERNPLRIGSYATGNAIINLNAGEIYTPGVMMNIGDSEDEGVSTINLNGGLLQIEGDSEALRMGDKAQIMFGAGVLRWKGDRIQELTVLIEEGRVSWPAGGASKQPECWDASWLNADGTALLYVDFNTVNAGYTTVWACAVLPPETLGLIIASVD
ncbi:hypothetical protein PDESU_03444 [Pontiella desulfatans]|uniref:Uncharacterized protein n=1 Tax=Pontiella desulfatans TaxID=2750659 RepID=A0A6C2U621_PONDE|nr:hypothetical protein [Pontiella desulfatans]VGO14874.1 hypothetical protein PDESU_03444 [Pontiella desulfatans]